MTAPTGFQFHNGTIKTPQVDQGRGTPTGFQFHNGTIKTNGKQLTIWQ